MAWTYEPSKLSDSPLMQARLLLGDTNEEDQLMQDEEIQFYLNSSGYDINRAAIKCIDVALSRIAAIPEYSLGPYRESLGNRIAFLNGLRDRLNKTEVQMNAPLSHDITSQEIFGYDMMSSWCDHTMGGGNSSE